MNESSVSDLTPCDSECVDSDISLSQEEELDSDQESISNPRLSIPRTHMNRLIAHIMKRNMTHETIRLAYYDRTNDDSDEFPIEMNLNRSKENSKLKMTEKARKLIHLHAEAFIMDLFFTCKEVNDLSRVKTIDQKTFKLCVRLMTKHLLKGP